MSTIAFAAATLAFVLATGSAAGVESAVVSLAPGMRDLDLEKLTIEVREALALRVPGVLSTEETRARMKRPAPAPPHGTQRGRRVVDRRTSPSPCQDAGDGATAPADEANDEAASRGISELRAIADRLVVERVYAVSLRLAENGPVLVLRAYDARNDTLFAEGRVPFDGDAPPPRGIGALVDDVATREGPGVPGGSPCGPRTLDEVPFDDRTMTHPVQISGPDPVYTPQALARGVQGTSIARCVVTKQGEVRSCRILKSLPFLDRAVIDALEHRRYKPVTQGGAPVEVRYDFHVPLRPID